MLITILKTIRINVFNKKKFVFEIPIPPKNKTTNNAVNFKS